jgi:hypothetical protein
VLANAVVSREELKTAKVKLEEDMHTVFKLAKVGLASTNTVQATLFETYRNVNLVG